MAILQLLAGERQQRESSKAVQACNDYLRMGVGRSLRSLLLYWDEQGQTSTPTSNFSTLSEWSRRYGWTERAESYDAEIDQKKTERANEIMQSGLALFHERVDSLKRLAVFLHKEIQETDKVWLPDVKQIGGGRDAKRVDIVRFNAPLIGEFRATLDDLAKETGGRKGLLDITSDDKPLISAALETALLKVYGEEEPEETEDAKDTT